MRVAYPTTPGAGWLLTVAYRHFEAKTVRG
jgi:hypothetical protein